MDFWRVIKRAAIAYARAKKKSAEEIKRFIAWLWERFELGRNEDLPKRRWEYKRQQEADFTSHAEQSLPEER